MAGGDELLIVDAREPDREGMRKLFDQQGYVCTATGSATEAIDLVGRKFFPVALVDLDLGAPGQGLDLVRAIRERSEPTAVILLSGRRSFEGAVEALRVGAADVILKQPDQVPLLQRAVASACARATRGGSGGDLLREVVVVLDEAFRLMLQMARDHYSDISTASLASFRPRLLVVEADAALLRELAGLIGGKPWETAAEMNGGGALDKAGSHRFDLVACRADLMDLHGSMVVKTIQAQRAETIGIVYTAPGPEGRADVFREGQLVESIRPIGSPAQLVAAFERIVDELSGTQRDRRVIQAFRSDHPDFFRRYAELKQRLASVLD